jgi:outer membrane protein assembly factor BamD (BamD/ComL family)
MFWKAESLFFADQYPEANDQIMELVKKYPGTRHLGKVMAREFAIAKYWQEHHMADPHWPVTPNVTDSTRHRFDTLGHALKAYEHIRLSDPTGDLADDALLATANSYFLRGRFDDADYHYTLLRQEYPKSEHQLKAHLLGLQSKMMKYQGSDYDGTSLDEAEKLVTQLLTQFSPQELGENRERVMKLRAEIAAQQALRSWNRAEYYAKGRYYAAARFYYQQIVKEHPTTKLAMESRERLESYQSLPDRPTPPVQWLASAFTGGPTGEESEPLPPPPRSSRSLASILFPFASNVKPEAPPPVEIASTPDSAPSLR